MIQKGFTLFEVLLVLAILSLLATIAYPNYRETIVRARRSDGQTALLELANRLEYYYSEQHSYQGATLGHSGPKDVLNSTYSLQSWYRLNIAIQTDTNFSIQAIPRKAQASQDLLCQTLTFNSEGVKGIIAGPRGSPTGTIAQCW